MSIIKLMEYLAMNLAIHIWYNMTMRPGRTLYVDGALIYKGIGFTDELEELWGKDSGCVRM